jgi:hypothetical protein
MRNQSAGLITTRRRKKKKKKKKIAPRATLSHPTTVSKSSAK